jgi:ribonuclease HI
MSQEKLPQITIYTDGACLGNPGPGGYGTIIVSELGSTELSSGYRLTTNNRMEMMAVIKGLEILDCKSIITICSDSKYVIDALDKGWARRWKLNGWMRNKKDKAINPDLWDQLLQLCSKHIINFVWIKGHSGHIQNERCDQLAVTAAKQSSLSEDPGYNP